MGSRVPARREQRRPTGSRHAEGSRDPEARRFGPSVSGSGRHSGSSLHDAIAALADAGLPLFERMRAESRCLPMKIGIWADISNRTDPAVHAALKVQVEILARARPYLAACAAEGAMRHDLDSNAVEAVTPEHRQQATRLRPQRKK